MVIFNFSKTLHACENTVDANDKKHSVERAGRRVNTIKLVSENNAVVCHIQRNHYITAAAVACLSPSFLHFTLV